MSNVDELVYIAKLSEQSDRYEDMVKSMKTVAEMDREITTEERNLLSVAYKNVVGVRRNAWRIVNNIEQKSESSESQFTDLTSKYKAQIESEIKQICNEIILIIDQHLFPKISDNETKVFYNKMKGDYYRYLAEFCTGTERVDASERSLVAYKSATEIAESLPKTNPICLGLALNFSVFYYEILNSPNRACKLAKAAFDEAIDMLDTLPEESHKDSTLILQLLRDNITLWTPEIKSEEELSDKPTEEPNPE